MTSKAIEGFWEMINIESTIRMEIMNGCTQASVAKICAFGIISSEKVNWGNVNKMLVNRWSAYGRENIMKIAWKMVDEKKKGGE